MKRVRRWRLFVFLLAEVILFTACGYNESDKSSEKKEETSLFAMNTYITLSAYGENADIALSESQERLIELENLWSVTDENSEIYKMNHSEGAPVTVKNETKQVISYALRMAEETNGALDPTLFPVLSAWGFTTGEYRIPDKAELRRLLKTVGYKNVHVEGNQIKLNNLSQLDLGAVGKGYAGDLITELLKERGITSALLNIGGNVQMIGTKPDGENWKIGLQNPLGEGNIGILSVSDCAVVTSGSYERYFTGEDGRVYGHILNSKTGYPVENNLASVTIIATEGKKSDALSTALYVMGLDNAVKYWRNNTGFDMILVTRNKDIYVTKGVVDKFELSDNFVDSKLNVIA